MNLKDNRYELKDVGELMMLIKERKSKLLQLKSEKQYLDILQKLIDENKQKIKDLKQKLEYKKAMKDKINADDKALQEML